MQWNRQKKTERNPLPPLRIRVSGDLAAQPASKEWLTSATQSPYVRRQYPVSTETQSVVTPTGGDPKKDEPQKTAAFKRPPLRRLYA